MRIAVIADIHGNCIALDAALSDIHASRVDRIVCLGDTVQGGSQPNETVERLRALACPIVMGNADDWLLKEEANSMEVISKEQREVRAWTISKLSSKNLDFIRGYQKTVKIALDNSRNLLCFHGSPKSYYDVLLPETPKKQWDLLLGPYSPAIMCGGHTHMQQVRRVREGLFFNPGSIGAPAYNHFLPKDKLHRDPWAEYAILSSEDGRLGLEFRRVNFDVDNLISIIHASARPYADKMITEYGGFAKQ